ncbi:MAG: 23S rRNA (adenine(2503)-C(2))-methyltransferase RlmN [Geobacteraceae bacterium GWC2_55_20]|nr:MAG: 23S rRNA (adenine(2503)-C(2))-methyltransferase RlmN [Geobacteraceae bacterium GWC2_55_20]OGU23645.1 MAG: 23S rRNA (adenine(2503)-C(2))-methyltransferase RlmN [Geobacteraceae bacterium GWF2_54_21]HBA71846.1 23S rRNA (adenine(2503)-C(2))-methyltransferase RlmN [Geobacter sp.]HCE69095.1 23S rRNA (adenine(2503)-C(2))-methyltransferase RlmN [Geobacter sp.]
MTEKTDLKNLTLPDLEKFLQGQGKERFRALQVFKWIYQHDARSFDEMTNISKDLRRELSETALISNLEPEAVEQGNDGTRKYLFNLGDGNGVEAVLIPIEGRNTLCISSQAGCAMGCEFCLTGTYKLTRNLTTAEIVNQIMAVERDLITNPPALPADSAQAGDDPDDGDDDDGQAQSPAGIRNIVMMGMGEPLHNLDNVIPAIRIMIDGNGLQFSNRRVTVSTCGLVPEMARLGREIPNVNLAVSLNATTDELRDRIMPVNRRYPIRELLKACKEFPLPGRRKVTFEYVMLGGINDTLQDARRLLRLISDIPNKVNLIPFNEHEGCEFKAPTQAAIDAFHKYLIDHNVTVITRDSRGGDISAACGQLKGKLEKA